HHHRFKGKVEICCGCLENLKQFFLGCFCPWRGAQELWRGAQAKLQEAGFGSGHCAARSPGWCNVR
ncbi:hypothetical protein A2U01_0082797, partial [Trifolium medium]|nr:hypothetical protein [Trifolium medium]